MLRQGFIALFLFSFSFLIKAAETFTSFKLPSVSAPQFPLSIQQDARGQTWLFADASVSLFTSDKFTHYRSFELPEEIIAGLLLPTGFLVATSKQVYFSKKDSNAPAVKVWSNSESKIINLHQVKDSIVITSQNQIHNIAISDLLVTQPKRLINLDSTIIHSDIDESNLYLLTAQQVVKYSLENDQETRFDSPLLLQQLVATKQGIYGLSANGELVKIFLSGSSLTMENTQTLSSQLLKANGKVLFISDNKLQSLDSNITIELPFITKQIYFDNKENVWLLSPYDVQVSWQQNISLSEFANQSLGRFDLYTEKYALKNDSLFLRNGSEHSWQMKLQLPNIANSKQIIIGKETLWFVKNNKLVALDKASYVQNYELDIGNKDLVFPISENKLMLITNTAMIEVSAAGSTTIVKSCERTCLPSFSVNGHLLLEKNIYLATNLGLREFDLSDLSFSEQRIDQLNSLSPVLSIEPDQGSQLWLLYPDKIALFDLALGTSEIYYSGDNRLFSISKEASGKLVLFSRKGWFEVTHENQSSGVNTNPINLHQVTENNQSIEYVAPESILQLTSTEQELKLAFNLAKQHAEQAVYFRFKYQDEPSWSETSQLSQSITLKNLRQGENTLLLQARLEGQDWGQTRQFNYQLPYKYLQTKWVLIYAIIALALAAAIYLFERYKRFKMAFDRLKQQAFINSLLESTKDGVWIANKDREIYSINQAFCDITGFTEEEVMQDNFKLNSTDGRNHELESLIWQEVTKTGFWTGEVWSQKKTGEAISIDLSVTRVETTDNLVNVKMSDT